MSEIQEAVEAVQAKIREYINLGIYTPASFVYPVIAAGILSEQTTIDSSTWTHAQKRAFYEAWLDAQK